MPDIQIFKFKKYKRTSQGQLIGPTDFQFVPIQILRKSTSIGIPSMRGDLNMPLNDDGTFAGGEWKINPNTLVNTFYESPIQVFDVDKAMQDVTKGLLTVRGTNYLAPNYGTSIGTLVNTRKLSDVATKITGEVQFILGYLAQSNNGFGDSEVVSDIVSLTGKEDKQTINLELTVRTLEGSQGSLLLT